MRFLAFLNRRYTPVQSIVLLVVAVAVVIGAQLTAIGIDADPVAAGITSVTIGMGAYFGTGALITRRTRG